MTVNFEKTVTRQFAIQQYDQPRRAQVYVGFQCHQGCKFCYYHDSCNEQMFSFEQVKKQIDFEYEYGIRDFEITGGEPSESLILRKVCEYIKSKDSSSKIAIITNGGLWNCNVWDLIDEVLVSYHLGKADSRYDKSVFPNGCTFSKVSKTVDAAKSHSVLVRTNTVLATFNLDGIWHIIDDLVSFKPMIVNFLPINLFDQAKHMASFIDYSKLRPLIKEAISALKAAIPSAYVFVRYMPFCEMNGYEQHVVGHLQHIYDWFDWNRELDGAEMISMADSKTASLIRLGKYGSSSVSNVMQTRKTLYSKSSKCLSCKYNIICDGVEKTDSNMLEKFIVPEHGTLVKDPMHYIGHITQDIYARTYAQ